MYKSEEQLGHTSLIQNTVPSTSEIDHLLSFVTIGELVASADCKLFMNKFKKDENTIAYNIYSEIYEDERKHYGLLRNILKEYSSMPENLRCLFKGDDLLDKNCVIEKMCLFHIVFESTAMAYIKFLLELENIDKNLRNILIEIAGDEARHITLGIESIVAELKRDIRKLQDKDEFVLPRLNTSLEHHKEVISSMPHHIFGRNSYLANKISSQFIQYYEINKERLFNGIR